MGTRNQPEVNLNDGRWHIDKRINASLIFTVIAAIVSFSFFLSQTRTDVNSNARAIVSLSHDISDNHEAIKSLRERGNVSRERLAKVEEAINSTNQLLRRILISVDRLNDRIDAQARSREGGSK